MVEAALHAINRYKAVVYKHYEVYNRDSGCREGHLLYDTMRTMHDVMTDQLKDLGRRIDHVMSLLDNNQRQV